MTISLEAAERIGNLTVFGFGFGLVFVGLICIIAICSIVGAVCKKLVKEDKKPVQATKAVSAADNAIPNKGEFIAAVSAALAEELGTDVTGIRILSVKKL